MDRKIKIVCDCDNILLDFSMGFSKWHNAKYDDMKISSRPSQIDFCVPHESYPELMSRMGMFWDTKESGELEYMESIIPDRFSELTQMGDVSVISAIHECYQEKRVNNLQMLDINDSDIICTKKKTDYIINTVKPDICIDDFPHNIEPFVDAGITTFFPSYLEYARVEHPLAIPYSDWNNLIDLIKNHAEL